MTNKEIRAIIQHCEDLATSLNETDPEFVLTVGRLATPDGKLLACTGDREISIRCYNNPKREWDTLGIFPTHEAVLRAMWDSRHKISEISLDHE